MNTSVNRNMLMYITSHSVWKLVAPKNRSATAVASPTPEPPSGRESQTGYCQSSQDSMYYMGIYLGLKRPFYHAFRAYVCTIEILGPFGLKHSMRT